MITTQEKEEEYLQPINLKCGHVIQACDRIITDHPDLPCRVCDPRACDYPPEVIWKQCDEGHFDIAICGHCHNYIQLCDLKKAFEAGTLSEESFTSQVVQLAKYSEELTAAETARQ